MNPSELNEEQKTDINERVAKAKKILEDLQLKPTASVQSVNIGNDIFSQKVIVYFQDMRYISPIKRKDL